MQFEIYMGCGIIVFRARVVAFWLISVPLKLLASLELPCLLDTDHHPPGQPGLLTLVWKFDVPPEKRTP